jgi:hypothetical protein
MRLVSFQNNALVFDKEPEVVVPPDTATLVGQFMVMQQLENAKTKMLITQLTAKVEEVKSLLQNNESTT